MANIFTTSLGKKVIMSLSGLFLILFLTMHACLNAAYLWSAEAFDHVCEFMSLPIIKIVTPVLAFGFIIHIIYAFVLYLQDY
ncbi:MAG: succinate dehydrogenase, partial [Bacteroidales bacterium]|nr:succinate dehydrogenase [Bacteroidales bacterium]